MKWSLIIVIHYNKRIEVRIYYPSKFQNKFRISLFVTIHPTKDLFMIKRERRKSAAHIGECNEIILLRCLHYEYAVLLRSGGLLGQLSVEKSLLLAKHRKIKQNYSLNNELMILDSGFPDFVCFVWFCIDKYELGFMILWWYDLIKDAVLITVLINFFSLVYVLDYTYVFRLLLWKDFLKHVNRGQGVVDKTFISHRWLIIKYY